MPKGVYDHKTNYKFTPKRKAQLDKIRNKVLGAGLHIHPDEKNGRWLGDKVSYRGMHLWIRRKLGSPTKCSHCDKEKTTPKSIHWANKSRKYKRELTDWVSLCSSCHGKYDAEHRRKTIKINV